MIRGEGNGEGYRGRDRGGGGIEGRRERVLNRRMRRDNTVCIENIPL